MKKTFLFFLAITLFIFACEKDDFCLENPVTPNLVLRFYDDVNRETLKKPASLYVWAEGKDSIFSNVTLDSIYIPLNSLELETVYNFSDGTNVDQFTITYTTEEEYVSRSCGYKIIFNDVNITSTNTWITDFTPSTLTTIDNQDAAHVQIYH
ncbi:DUF6452 family protein [Polaribacter sargassicola]|uniref:DUF6452 family protein n=1 Tax=Polaribacter sargassicola TaxID=2836891 RepID=UPI001F2A17E2|nr:DUF6452 family protein [Polaribacter sp. DS7-9]MCG1036450.1 hypothetical protein [Polaribacter sp. DS7-9]